MATKEEIRAVFADPQLDGMDALYQSIGEIAFSAVSSAVALAISDTHMGNELILVEGIADSIEQQLDPEELNKPA